MESLFKKLNELEDLLKQTSATLKLPKLPSMPKPTGMPTISKPPSLKTPGVSPVSKKDPVKIAQQLKNPKETKPKTSLKISKLGQWSM